MFEAVHAAIRHARHELARGNVKGSVIIELEPREWDHFRSDLRYFNLTAPSPFLPSDVDTCQLDGATVRLKR